MKSTIAEPTRGIPMVHVHTKEPNFAYFYVNKWEEGRGFNLTIASSWGCWNAGFGAPSGGPTKFLRECANNLEYLQDKFCKPGNNRDERMFARMHSACYAAFINEYEAYTTS